ncbi:leucyl aminopeptidase family protein [Thalassotalea sp. PLHSN55]|uniref:leucyl aminopeptidase family protein n=1 Tax=Thalassotalea sp. PLHSN55 TaxID=3435888 RepID=UPI003F84C075
MNSILVASDQGTPLHILKTSEYQNWLSQQDTFTQKWLEQTRYSGEGLSLIPNNSGELSQVLFIAKQPEHYFACGDLSAQLPKGQYQLHCDAAEQKAIAFAWAVGSYQFDRYKKSNKEIATLAINNEDIVSEAIIQAQATALVRDMVNTPAADMMPENIAACAFGLTEQFGGKVEQIIGNDLLDKNYPTIHAVGRASLHKPRLIDLTWGDESHLRVTLVGKGVCFDSGGLDLKPAAGMRFMKKDMGGSAHVLGLAHLIMANNLPINLRVLIPAVENAVSSNALRPGDVIKTRKGITVEIDNTDAEGRLVLCDALAEAENDNPELLIDFATLTGAMRVALGTELPGFFSTNSEIAAQITLAGEKINDPVWRMPLYSPYKDLLKSNVADMTNCATVPQGGAITAALYLQEFVNPDTNWLHFDVMAWNTRALTGRPIGGEAFGIRAVYAYLAAQYK